MFICYGNQHQEVSLNDQDPAEIILQLSPLGKISKEEIAIKNATFRNQGSFSLWEGDDFLFGFSKTKVTPNTDSSVASSIYNELFEITKKHFLYRTWNYVPDINSGEGDQERYKQFCEGRSKAFHEAFGEKEFVYMPAGTGVGIDGEELVICFIAGTSTPDHHENPKQIPAYRYPRQYGPKTPSFARATSVHVNNKHYRFISGTAAVLGHESKGINSLQQQLEITCDNLEEISNQTQTGIKNLERPITTAVSGKVYLRNSENYQEVKSYLDSRFPDISDSLIYIESDICRKELLVEIELLFIDTVE